MEINKTETTISELIPKLYAVGINMVIIQEQLNKLNNKIKQPEDNK